MKGITKTQDTEGHWYWIPNDMLSEFNEMRDNLPLFYMDNPDLFDQFSSKFEQYRTSGCENTPPEVFNWVNGVTTP